MQLTFPWKCSYDFLDKIQYCDSIHKYVDTLRSQAFKSTRCWALSTRFSVPFSFSFSCLSSIPLFFLCLLKRFVVLPFDILNVAYVCMRRFHHRNASQFVWYTNKSKSIKINNWTGHDKFSAEIISIWETVPWWAHRQCEQMESISSIILVYSFIFHHLFSSCQ